MELFLQLRVYFSKFYFFFGLKFWLIRFANQFNFLRFGCVELNEKHPLSKWGFKTTFHDKNVFFTAFYKFDRCECSISLPPPSLSLSLSHTHTHIHIHIHTLTFSWCCHGRSKAKRCQIWFSTNLTSHSIQSCLDFGILWTEKNSRI